LEGAAGPVIDFDFFGANSCFAFELLGRHEKVEQGNQWPADGGEEGLFLKALKPVIAGVFTDHGSIFLLRKAVVILFAVTAAGKSGVLVFAPAFGGVIDKLRAVIAVELPYGEGEEVFRSGKASRVHFRALLRRE
jgi:hypothetical protein